MKEESSLKKYLIILGIISLMALALRLIAGWQMYKSVPAVFDPSSQTDMYTYLLYGKQFAEGTYNSHGGAYYYQPFYYAVFLRVLFTIFGSDPLVVVIAQSILGAATIFLTGILGARLGGKKAGIIAALILTLFRNHILYTPFALIAILQTFLITLSVYLVFIAFDKKKWQYWALVGLVMSCSILSRGNFLLLIPFVMFFIWRVHKPGVKSVLIPMAAFLLAVYLPQMPFSLKNYQVTGEWTGPSTAGDIVLSIGNNPDAPPGTEDLPGPHYINYDEYSEVSHWPQEKDQELGDSIKSWIKNNPLHWLEMKFKTLFLYVSNHEAYNNITLSQSLRALPWLNSYILLDFWIVAIPFLVLLIRIVLSGKFSKRKNNYLLITVIVYSASIVIFYVLSRYKLPIIPLLSVCAGMEFVRWVQMFKSTDKKRKLLLALTLLFSMFLVLRWFDIYHLTFGPSISKSLLPNGRFFETEKALYVKDVGNPRWGGWEPQLIENRLFLNKKFIVPKEVNSSGTLRLYCGVVEPTTIQLVLRHAGRLYPKNHTFSSGLGGWVEIPMEKVVSEEHVVKFEIEVNSLKPAGVFFTPLVNYGRSQINGQALDGEWIIQLKIDK